MRAMLTFGLASALLLSPSLAQDCPGAAGVAYVYWGNTQCHGPHTTRRWDHFNDQANFACWNLDQGEARSIYKSKSDGRCSVRFYTDRNCKNYLDASSISEWGCKTIPPGAKSWDSGCNLPDPPCEQ